MITILIHQVGYVRQIELIKDEKPFTVKTLSVRPPIFGRCKAASRAILQSTSTAVSTKVVPQKCKSVRDNADWYYG